MDAWQHKATADADQVGAWWRRWPQANVAIATGAGSGLFVVDIDGEDGERTLDTLEREHGEALPELFPQAWTSKGWHAFLAYPEGRDVITKPETLGPKVDTRGHGGYVIAPPSIHPSGVRYEWAADRNPILAPLAPAPEWVLSRARRPAPDEPSEAAQEPRGEWHAPQEPKGARYALRALESELALVAVSPEGRRNDQLNRSAHALFRFVAAGELAIGPIAGGLTAAGRHAGLAPSEINATLKSAATARGVAL